MLFQYFFVLTLLCHLSFAETEGSSRANGTEKECGVVTSSGRMLRDATAKRGELPWQAIIYSKTTTPYRMICGGSLVRNDIVISAAHCFWSEVRHQLPAAEYAVAVGKLYRPWSNKVDEAQKSDVKEIHLTPRYFGAAANYENDIAVVVLTSPFTYNSFVKPVCLSFDAQLDNQQLQAGNQGKIGTWGQDAQGNISPILHVGNLPYMDVEICISKAPADFLEYITSDKFCAGSQKSDFEICRGDGGNGLSFPVSEAGDVERYYLRGVTSVAPTSEGLCSGGIVAFTKIRLHEDFIKMYLN